MEDPFVWPTVKYEKDSSGHTVMVLVSRQIILHIMAIKLLMILKQLFESHTKKFDIF